jgi:hypothetical protein
MIDAGIVAAASFTPAAAAYSAGDVMSTAQTLAFTYGNATKIRTGSLIRIIGSVLKIDQTALQASEAAYTLHLYSVTPPSAQADNDAWTLASADLPSYLGSLNLGTPVDLGAACYVRLGAADTDLVFKMASTSLFGALVTVAGFTPTAVARQVTLYGVTL